MGAHRSWEARASDESTGLAVGLGVGSHRRMRTRLAPMKNLVLVPPFPAGAGIRPVHPTTQRKPRLNPVAPLPRLGQLKLLPDLQGGAVVFSHAIHRQQLFQGDVVGGGDCSAGVSGNDLVRLP